MSKDTQFQPGQSGNPAGRPRKPRRPHLSAFEIILDQTLETTRDGKPREASVEEALQQQTLKDALAGKRMAIRQVLKMIENREAALAKKNRPRETPVSMVTHHDADNANEAMRILDIAEPDPSHPKRWKLNAWATQAALSRPGRKKLPRREVEQIKFFTKDAGTLRWPPGRIE
ncbi:DUF5681 domain-containing protein [Erythrobacter sp. HA6-11]